MLKVDNLHNFSNSMNLVTIFNLFTHIYVGTFWKLVDIWTLYVKFWGVVWMVQAVHCSLCRVLYIRNIIKVDGVFVSYNLFYTSHSCGLLWKHICNFQYPNIKTKTDFIDVDYGIYIQEACPLLVWKGSFHITWSFSWGVPSSHHALQANLNIKHGCM